MLHFCSHACFNRTVFGQSERQDCLSTSHFAFSHETKRPDIRTNSPKISRRFMQSITLSPSFFTVHCGCNLAKTQRLAMIQTAWTIPGIYPNRVSTIFSQNAPPIPTWRKTPSGGKRMATIIRTKSIDGLLMFRAFRINLPRFPK